ncbi:TPA: hypothetical protein ROA76_004376 [Escherichia coli]|nr:hypothetical protein [Escherichia coli]
MKKANVRISASGVNDSLMHIEARKDSHPNETLFVTWCKVSDNRYHYAWQLMHEGAIKSADCSDRTVSHEELGRNVEALINNTFIDKTFHHIDQFDYEIVD